VGKWFDLDIYHNDMPDKGIIMLRVFLSGNTCATNMFYGRVAENEEDC